MRPSVLKERLSALYTEKAAAYKAQCEGDNIPDKVVNRFVNKPSQIIGISLLCTVHRYQCGLKRVGEFLSWPIAKRSLAIVLMVALMKVVILVLLICSKKLP